MRNPPMPVLAILLVTAGCASLQLVNDPARYILESRPEVVFATHKNGSVLAVAQPRVSGDSLLGTRQGLALPLALPLSHFQRIEAVQRDKKRTTAVIVGVTAVGATLGYLLLQKVGGSGKNCDYTGVTHPFPGCDDPRPGH